MTSLIAEGLEEMKMYRLLVVLALVFSAAGSVTSQSRGESGTSQRVPAASSKPSVSASKLPEIQKILSDRRSGSLAPDDACSTTVPIVVGTPIVGALATTDCVLTDGSFIDYYDFQGTAGQAISFSEVSSAFDTYLVLLDSDGNSLTENDDSGGTSDSRIPVDSGVITLPYTGHYTIGANSYDAGKTGAYTVSVASSAACVIMPIFYNQTPAGTFASTSCPVSIDGQNYYTDLYTFYGVAGKQISITQRSTAVDSYLVLHTPSGANSPEDDDSGGGSDSRIPGATGTYTLPETGIYTIEASTFNSLETGAYTISLTGPATGSISGKIVSPSGVGLRNSTVVLTDALGVKRTSTTSSFGFYNFDNVAPGPNYTLSIASRLYRFAPQPIQFNDDLTNINFTGLE